MTSLSVRMGIKFGRNVGRGILCVLAFAMGPMVLMAMEFEVGGPLEGPRLPLFPTQQGEAAGYPGCIPELMAQGKSTDENDEMSRQWSSQGQMPQFQLYP